MSQNNNLNVEVLRLFDGKEYQQGWHSMGDSGYVSQDIEKIIDPASGTSKEITSIPSPFARINLFEHAFKAVNNQGKNNSDSLSESTMFHKLVSECLDVGEIFFNFRHLIDAGYTLDVVTWNKREDLERLKDSNIGKHGLLGDTLELFLNQDSEGSSFDQVDNLHILECEYKVIGGTSPSTLFFGGYNDNYNLSALNLKAGNDTLFDNVFCPLHRRSMLYQRFLHGLFKVHPRLQRQMPLFYDYLQVSLRALEKESTQDFNALQEFINKLEYTEEDYNNEFEELNTGSASGIIDIAKGVYLRRKGEVQVQSDFAIKSDFSNNNINGKTPLVLVNGFRKPLQYFNGTWDAATSVPYKPEQAPEERILPGQTDKYPYLTVSDFLEPSLIQLEFRINQDRFFDGNPQNFFPGNRADVSPPDASYLLPIKPLFFQFFSVDTLMGNAPDGKPVFRMSKIGADSVRVELRIPIAKAGECVVLERSYRHGALPDEADNEGSIFECQFNVGFLPMVSVRGNFLQYVGIADNDILKSTLDHDYKLTFLQQGEMIPVEPDNYTEKSNKVKHNRNATTRYYTLKEHYDVLVVDNEHARGIIVPLTPELQSGGDQFSFAVDFGTTNTHVEYAVNGKPPQPFTIEKRDIQLMTLIEPDSEWYFNGFTRDIFLHELIPEKIGPGQLFQFPIRTVTTEIQNLDHNKATSPVSDVNISFVYEKLAILKQSLVARNLKWQNFDPEKGIAAESRLRCFLGELLILIRNKVLMNGGSLDQTKLVWFFPSSMDQFTVNAFNKIWKELFQEYITENNDPVRYSEAVAPFYTHQKINASLIPVASIDIGGGTSDFAVFKGYRPLFVSSAKFAGNTVWGDGFYDQPDYRNGIVRVFQDTVSQFLEANRNEGLYQLAETYEQLIGDMSYSSSDIMSFFFSIDRNQDVLNGGHKFDFSGKVAEFQDFKIVFLVFYAANIYYLARMMQITQLEMPRYIALNGNGSKLINLLDPDPKFKASTKLAKFIFEYVYGKAYAQDGLDIVQSKEPKEATCKGGLKRVRKSTDEVEYDAMVWLGDEPSDQYSLSSDAERDGYDTALGTIVNQSRVNYASNNLKYKDITEEQKERVIEQYKGFLHMLQTGHDELNYRNLFGVRGDKMDVYFRILRRDIHTNLARGLSVRQEMTSASETVVESLFFYPLIGGIYALMEDVAADLGR